MSAEIIISVKDLQKHFNAGAVHALNGVSVDIEKSEVLVVIGPSGSGKSTFLRCLNLLERPTGGSVVFEGTDITAPRVNINLYRRRIPVCLQNAQQLPPCAAALLCPKIIGKDAHRRFFKEGKINCHTLIQKLAIDNFSAGYRANHLCFGEHSLNSLLNFLQHGFLRRVHKHRYQHAGKML